MITLEFADKLSKQRLDTLADDFRNRCFRWYEKALEAGLKLLVTEGFRSFARQQELYNIGRTVPGKRRTDALPGQSFHNYGHAFDWVPLSEDGKAADMYNANYEDSSSYKIGQEIGVQFDLRPISWETPHLEDGKFKNWHELKAYFDNLKSNAKK